MSEADPTKPSLRLVVMQHDIPTVIAMFATAAAHAEVHGGARNASGVLPIRQVSIETAATPGNVSFHLHLEGGLRIPLAVPASLAIQIADSLRDEARKTLGTES